MSNETTMRPTIIAMPDFNYIEVWGPGNLYIEDFRHAAPNAAAHFRRLNRLLRPYHAIRTQVWLDTRRTSRRRRR